MPIGSGRRAPGEQSVLGKNKIASSRCSAQLFHTEASEREYRAFKFNLLLILKMCVPYIPYIPYIHAYIDMFVDKYTEL